MSGADTVEAVFRRHAALFRAARIENPDMDARLLLGEAMQLPRLASSLHGNEIVSAQAMAVLASFAQRRMAGEPVDRIIGYREFWGLTFHLGTDTLAPRPDSESLVDAALERLKDRRNEALSIIDLGTGSGCLLVSLLHEFPLATGIGIDLSQNALHMARCNAAAAGVGHRAMWVAANWGDSLIMQADLVISNPPYIPTEDIIALQREVKEHDPMRALDGGGDGLDAYRSLGKAMSLLMKPDGLAILELGTGQLEDVTFLMKQSGLVVSGSRKDLGGHDRALVLTRKT